MTIAPAGQAAHPHLVAIPHSATLGVRAYREPAEPHPLQLTFLQEADERAWVEDLRNLLAAGRFADADARLAAELAGFDGTLARLCKALPTAEVALDGWEDLLPILEEWEGPPITAITVGLTNAPDLVFESGQLHQPDVLLGLYSDDAYPFSTASDEALLAECEAEMPRWVGGEEDVEFYCDAAGLAELNTALIGCKHRHFLRDGRDGVEARAPGGYVEYVLGCWLLATRFLQAVERASADGGLPPGCRLIAGTVGLNADLVTLMGHKARATSSAPKPNAPQFAALTMKPWVPREDPDAVAPPKGSTLRQRLITPEQPAPPVPEAAEPPPPARPGFLARLFGRFRRG